MKDSHFKLSNTFTSLLANKQQITKKREQKANKSLDDGLFKLNPANAHELKDVPVQILRKKSKSKLQSLKDQSNKKSFSIFNQKIQQKDAIEANKNKTKKYKIDMGNLDNIQRGKSKQQKAQQELPYDIVPPSKLNDILLPSSMETNSCLFQTPLLPCFASQFRHTINQNEQQNLYKCVQQPQGVWKVGKIKIKGNKAKLFIGDIQFEATKAEVAGKAGVVSQENFFQLNNWKNIWVVQPSQKLYL